MTGVELRHPYLQVLGDDNPYIAMVTFESEESRAVLAMSPKDVPPLGSMVRISVGSIKESVPAKG